MTMLGLQLSPLLRTTIRQVHTDTVPTRSGPYSPLVPLTSLVPPGTHRGASARSQLEAARERFLLGLHEPAERRQGASGHGSGRQACERSRRWREAMSEIGRAHALHTVTVWCKCIDFVCVRAVHHVSTWVELLNTTATDHIHLYYAV